MIHGIDTSFLVAVEASSHHDHAACHARLQRLLKAQPVSSGRAGQGASTR